MTDLEATSSSSSTSSSSKKQQQPGGQTWTRLRKTNRSIVTTEPQTLNMMVGRRHNGLTNGPNRHTNNACGSSESSFASLSSSTSSESESVITASPSSSSTASDTSTDDSSTTSTKSRGGSSSSSSSNTNTHSCWRPSLVKLCLAFRGMCSGQKLLWGVFLLAVLPYGIHRVIVWYKGSKSWVVSPIMHLERQCPEPTYERLTASPEGQEAASKLKICLTTLTDEKTKDSVSSLRRKIRWRNYDNVLELTWPSKQAYAQKHGYYLFDSSDVVQQGRPTQWSKIVAVKRLLDEEHCDWALWMDADTLFMNTDKRIEDFLPADPNTDLLVAVDAPNPGYNSGSWLVKNSDWGRRFLQSWWDMKSYVRLPGQSLSGDNDAFKVLLGSYGQEEFQRHIGVPPRCTINAFAKFLRPWEIQAMTDEEVTSQPWYLSENYYHKGDWLVHVPGYDNKVGTLQMLMEEIE